jgi:outer membrane protein assembly factor BamA
MGSRRGKNQVITTAEYRFTLMNPRLISYFGVTTSLGVQLAVFADAGSAWTLRDEFRNAFIGGSGVGIRLILPSVGMARMDFGIGQESAGVEIHLGADEKAVLQRERVR